MTNFALRNNNNNHDKSIVQEIIEIHSMRKASVLAVVESLMDVIK